MCATPTRTQMENNCEHQGEKRAQAFEAIGLAPVACVTNAAEFPQGAVSGFAAIPRNMTGIATKVRVRV